MNYYPHHIGDYAKDTGHLTWDEDMAYTRLLRAYYSREGPIPADQAYRLARAASTAQKKAVDSVLAEFFTKDETGWHNKRADAELAIAHEKSEKARTSAAKRWQGGSSNANAMRTHTEGNATQHTEGNAPNNQEPITKNQRKNTARKRAIPPDFGISDRVTAWATEKGYDRLAEHLDAFKRKVAAGGYVYVDWDAAFMEAVREDWAKLRPNGKGGHVAPPPLADGKITCVSCGSRTSSYTGRQCDPCWRGERRVAV